MKGSESRDRERKKEILEMFKPKSNKLFIYKNYPRRHNPLTSFRSGKVKVFSAEEIALFDN